MYKSTSAPKRTDKGHSVVKTDLRAEIFKKLEALASTYAPPLTFQTNQISKCSLISKKPVEYLGRKMPEMYFGAVQIHKGFTALYLMHIYVQPDKVEKLSPNLKKLLKGKSCFHIKHLDSELETAIKKAMDEGIACYKKLGFI